MKNPYWMTGLESRPWLNVGCGVISSATGRGRVAKYIQPGAETASAALLPLGQQASKGRCVALCRRRRFPLAVTATGKRLQHSALVSRADPVGRTAISCQGG